jgi:hypothetical protein
VVIQTTDWNSPLSNAVEHLIRIPVMVEYLDGTKQDLSVITPRAMLKLTELVNREETFIDAESLTGERFLIAKTAIRTIRARAPGTA